MSDGPYHSGFASESEKFVINGPGNYGYYSGTLFKENLYNTREECDRVCRHMNAAYREGERARSASIKALLG